MEERTAAKTEKMTLVKSFQDISFVYNRGKENQQRLFTDIGPFQEVWTGGDVAQGRDQTGIE